MAHPSPSPSCSSRNRRRRLSEVLGEQQEPFSLDIYLLERGCSPAFLDATTYGHSGGACSTCWPNTRITGADRLPRRPARTNKKGSRRSGVLTMLLSKILSGRTTAPPATKKKNRQQRWRRRVAGKQRTPDRFELAVHSASPGDVVEAHMEDDGDGEQEDEPDDEDDGSSKKQLSPVSVLEQRLFEHSSSPLHTPKAIAVFGELLEAAYTPNVLLNDDDVLAIAKDPSRTQSKDGRHHRSSSITDSSTPPPTPRARRWRSKNKKKQQQNAHRKEDVALEKKDLARLTSLVASEMAGATSVCPEDLQPSVEDVGVLIAAAVLETLTEETAAELMGMDRGSAVDTTRC